MNWLFKIIRKIYYSIFGIKTRGVRAIILDSQKRIILVQCSYPPFRGYWVLPGGGIKKNEDWIDGIKREIREEIGIEIKIDYLLGIYKNQKEGKKDLIRVYVCDGLGDTHEKTNLEISKIIFFKLDKLPDRITPGTQRRLDEYKSSLRKLNRTW